MTRAAKLLGVRYQTLGSMLEKRHKKLLSYLTHKMLYLLPRVAFL